MIGLTHTTARRTGAIGLAGAFAALLATTALPETTPDPRATSTMVPSAIYDTDDRTLIGEASATAQTLAESVVALVSVGALQPHGSGYKVWAPTLGEDMDLCPGERFEDVQAPALCSGVLIAPDQVLMAGHCVPDMVDCQSYHYVLGLEVTDRNPENLVDDSQVYACAGIEYTGGGALDATILRLDRPVPDRTPIPIDTTALAAGDPIFMIGHPSGLPQVLTDNAQVLAVRDQAYLTDLDAFGGNSGSPVFNEAGAVAGILVSGQADYDEISGGGRRCTKPVYYDCDGGRCDGGGEEVLRSEPIARLMDMLPTTAIDRLR